jgi:hypothetical protein
MYHILFGPCFASFDLGGWPCVSLQLLCSYSASFYIFMGVFTKAVGALEFGQLQYRLVSGERDESANGEGKQFRFSG